MATRASAADPSAFQGPMSSARIDPRTLLRSASAVALVAVIACSKSGSLACAQSVASYCATNESGCDANWSAAQARWEASLCSDPDNALETGCGGFNVLYMSNINVPSFEYFDVRSGDLVAIVVNEGKSGGGETCVAGPSAFASPGEACTAGVAQTTCLDSGTVDAPGD